MSIHVVFSLSPFLPAGVGGRLLCNLPGGLASIEQGCPSVAGAQESGLIHQEICKP